MMGAYARTFAEATHALAEGMPMNADYPFKTPTIVSCTEQTVTIEGRDGARETLAIRRDAQGREFAELEQASTFERLYRRPPTKFKLHPFKEDR